MALQIGGENWRAKARAGLLPVYVLELLRNVYIRSGGSKNFTGSGVPHQHVLADKPYARICSPIRQLDCLLNDAYLCNKITREEALGFIQKLNDAIPEERGRRRRADRRRLFRPFGPCILTQGVGSVRVYSVWRQSEIKVVPAIMEQNYVHFKVGRDGEPPSTVVAEIGSVVHLDGVLDDGALRQLHYVDVALARRSHSKKLGKMIQQQYSRSVREIFQYPTEELQHFCSRLS